MTRCPQCKAADSIYFEGVAIIPVSTEPEYDDPIRLTHFWDWENAEIIDERGYFCRDCDASYIEPHEFVVQAEGRV